jgi:hypothetical protein
MQRIVPSERKEGRFDRIEWSFQLHGDLNGEQRARLLEIAQQRPVHRTLLSEARLDGHKPEQARQETPVEERSSSTATNSFAAAPTHPGALVACSSALCIASCSVRRDCGISTDGVCALNQPGTLTPYGGSCAEQPERRRQQGNRFLYRMAPPSTARLARFIGTLLDQLR